MKSKFQNPWFWLGIISIVFASAGIDFNTLTSWKLLADALLSILQNPVALMAVVGGVLGVFNDNGTPGFDKVKQVDSNDESKNIPGVCWNASNNKWKAYISIEGKQKHLGYFDNIEDAIQARKDAEESYKNLK